MRAEIGITLLKPASSPFCVLAHDSFVAPRRRATLNYWWTFGAMLSLCPSSCRSSPASCWRCTIPQHRHGVREPRRDVPVRLAHPEHPLRRRFDVLLAVLHPYVPWAPRYYGSYKPRANLLLDLGAASIYLPDGRHRLPWLHAAVGPDVVLGRHCRRTFDWRAHSSARRSRTGCGRVLRRSARRSTASSRCTICRRSSSALSAPAFLGAARSRAEQSGWRRRDVQKSTRCPFTRTRRSGSLRDDFVS